MPSVVPWVFYRCSKLAPSHIDVDDVNEVENDVTTDVVHHLRTQQRISILEKMLADRDTP